MLEAHLKRMAELGQLRAEQAAAYSAKTVDVRSAIVSGDWSVLEGDGDDGGSEESESGLAPGVLEAEGTGAIERDSVDPPMPGDE